MRQYFSVCICERLTIVDDASIAKTFHRSADLCKLQSCAPSGQTAEKCRTNYDFLMQDNGVETELERFNGFYSTLVYQTVFLRGLLCGVRIFRLPILEKLPSPSAHVSCRMAGPT